MKRCDNCFESNSDGATNCVICGDPLDIPQVAGHTSVALAKASPVEDDLQDAPVRAPLSEPEDDLVEPEDDLVEVEVEIVEDFDEDPTATIRRPALEPESAPEPAAAPPAPQPQPAQPQPAQPQPPVPDEGGTIVLQVFHDTEPRVVHAHPVVNDITLVGREDPQRDVFPDLDLGKLPASEVSSGHASRQHLRLLRQGGRYYLYVYKGSTGTQVCDRMVDPASYGKRFEIQVGDRIILGGKVRMKLARVK